MTVVQRAIQWQVCAPVVYRHLEREYVDRFFSTGELRLASFSAFKKHTDEQRKDVREGFNMVVGKGANSTLFAVVGRGQASAYVLSTSMRPDLGTDFRTDDAIVIRSPHQFGVAVAQALDGCTGGLEGHCCYVDGWIEHQIPDIDLDAQKNPDGTLPMDKVLGVVNQTAGPAEYLRKSERYQHQQEYRFVWFVPRAEDNITIKLANVGQFAERLVSP